MNIVLTRNSHLQALWQQRNIYFSQAGAGFLGFFLGGAMIGSATAPFGVAWLAAVPDAVALPALVGTLLGYLILRPAVALRYAAALLLFVAFRFGLRSLSAERRSLFSPLIGAIAVGITGGIVTFSVDRTGYAFLLLGLEMIITASAGLLFAKALRGVENGIPFLGTNAACTGLLLAIGYLGLSVWRIGLFTPARALAFFAILCGGMFLTQGVEAAIAITAGLAAALVGQPDLLLPYCVAGLASGIFSPLGRFGVSAATFGAVALTLVAQRGEIPIGLLLLELGLALLVFLLLPVGFLRRVGLLREEMPPQGEALRQILLSRLSETKGALQEISSLTGEMSKTLETLQGDPIETTFAKACASVCRGCVHSPRCWQSGYQSTTDALSHAFAAARNQKAATAEDLPDYFDCEREASLLDAINRETAEYLDKRNARRHAAQLRGITADQFEGMQLLLGQIERELGAVKSLPDERQVQVGNFFVQQNLPPQSLCCFLDEREHLHVLAHFPLYKGTRLLAPALTASLSELLSQELASPTLREEPDGIRALWSAKTPFALETAFLQRAAHGNRYCGDNCTISQPTPMGQIALLLCDGMGVGSAAAVDSTLTAMLLERLLRAGSDFPSALQMVNASLLSGGGEERLCTVDAALFDLHTARLNLFKAGAAPSFVLRQGRVAQIVSPSLPVGILGGVTAEQTSLSLSEGDLLLLVSDGVTDGGSDWIPSQLQLLATLPLDRICENLLDVAKDRRRDGHEDDMSVLIAKVVKR